MGLFTLLANACICLFWLFCYLMFYVVKLDGIYLWIIPCCDTFSALKQSKTDTFKRQLCFWMILGAILSIEYITYVLYYYVTLYRILRLTLMIWLKLNDYTNSEKLFNLFASYIPLLSYQDNYDNMVNYINSLIVRFESHYCSTFKSQDVFAQNVDLCDTFIHINIDYNNPKQVNQAINLATSRAFQSRFVPPITGITKGKAFGQMLVLSPTGLSKKYKFDGDSVYRGSAEFRKSDNRSDTFICYVYYYQLCFNPIRLANGVDSSNVKFITEVGHTSYTINNDDAYNCLYTNMTNKLQRKYLNKMTEKNKINKIYDSDTLPGSDILKISTTGPKKSCRAHFTGLFVGGTFKDNFVSVAYKIDRYSEYVGQGEYPKNKEAFPKAVATTFDGIAIDANTRVVIYEKENFEGAILLDVRGPKIINNVLHQNNAAVNHCMTDIFPDTKVQENFPINVRIWSDSNMHPWSYGSVKILSNGLS